MSTIKTKDGTEIFYKDWGTGQPIVFHHGWPLSGDDWDTQMLFFLSKGYRVCGMVRRASTENFARIDHLHDRVQLHQADLLDQLSIVDLIRKVRPHEVYNLAAQTFVPTSWTQPLLTGEFTALGVTRLLEAIRLGVEWAIAHRAVFDFLSHPSCLYVVDPEFRAIELICDLVAKAGDRAAIVDLGTIARRAKLRKEGK